MTRAADEALQLERPRADRAWLEPLLLACALAVWFGYQLDIRPLWAPDEGRYAEIPREMVASGDYLTPRLNGVKYFEKPPLVYWLTAGSIRLFGLNEWALRLWPALFALAGCMAVYVLARRLYAPRAGLCAALVLALAPLYNFMGGTLTLDMPLAAWITAAMAAFLIGVREAPGVRRRLWLYGFYAAVACAVLTKGLVGMVIPAMVIGAWVAVVGAWRLLREIHLPTGLLILLGIAAPWHILVAQANPEFFRFYVIHEHIERYLTTVHHRYQPLWFFLPVLLVGLFPWSALLPRVLGEALAGLWRERRERRETWFLLLWAALPFAFFSFSGSKLIPYILPVLPPLALLIGHAVADAWQRSVPPARSALRLLAALGAVLAAAWTALPWLLPDSANVASTVAQLGTAYHLIAALWLAAGAAPWVARRIRADRASWIAFTAGAALLLSGLDATLTRVDVGRSVKAPALALKGRLAPGDEVMAYRQYYQDLPVYLERRVTVVDWKGELEFGTSVEDTSGWMIDEAEFLRRWRGPGRVFLFASYAGYATLRGQPPGPLCRIDATSQVVVLFNRECGA